jgi:hypothetical protein
LLHGPVYSVLIERARATWADERLDDLARRMDDGFRRIDDELRALRSDMNLRFETHDARFDSLQRTIIQVGGGIIATFVVGFISLVATGL